MPLKENNSQASVSISGNMDGNIIVGNGNQITVSSLTNADKTASEMAILRLEKEIEDIKNADNQIGKIKRKYYLPECPNSYFSRGLAHILVNKYHRKPSEFLKMWNGTGFKDKETNSVLVKLTVDEMHILKTFFSDYSNVFSGTPTVHEKRIIKEITEDVQRLITLEESKTLLDRKEEELRHHKKTVELK